MKSKLYNSIKTLITSFIIRKYKFLRVAVTIYPISYITGCKNEVIKKGFSEKRGCTGFKFF